MNNQHKTLVGSWHVDAATPSQGAFPALLTFTTDGCVIANQSPGQWISAGHGNWSGDVHAQVAYTFVALIGSETGKNRGKLKVVGTLQFHADLAQWRGPFKIDVLDAQGEITFTDHGTFDLTRIAIDPLE